MVSCIFSWFFSDALVFGQAPLPLDILSQKIDILDHRINLLFDEKIGLELTLVSLKRSRSW